MLGIWISSRAAPAVEQNYAREPWSSIRLVPTAATCKRMSLRLRVLTGWTFNDDSRSFIFDPAIHDWDAKR